MGAATLLADLIARGITLTPNGTSLRVRGTLTDEDRTNIRVHKAELLTALAAKVCNSCNWLTPAGSCVRGLDASNPTAARACPDWRARVLIELPRAATAVQEPRSEPAPVLDTQPLEQGETLPAVVPRTIEGELLSVTADNSALIAHPLNCPVCAAGPVNHCSEWKRLADEDRRLTNLYLRAAQAKDTAEREGGR